MVRILSLAAAMLLTTQAFAGQGADPQSPQFAGASIPVAFQPAADKVYPPLPTLAMLPPSGSDDESPAKPSPRRKKAHVSAPVQKREVAPTPVIRLVVSDTSRAYLDSVQRQIEVALAK
jgi:hypothetical protein